MDSTRVEAYLRSICSVLSFDIGELWCCRDGPDDSKPQLQFVQLHTSPNYKDRQPVLIHPQLNEHTRIQPDEEVHRFSPVICRAVCDGGQIVWSNTFNTEGLVGRSDVPLNTAVGMPVCSIDGDLYMLVLFAVESIQMTPNAVDFLWTMTRAITEASSGFLPASVVSEVTKAKTEKFTNVWDVSALMGAYYNDVAFHLLPIARMQEFFDFQEASSFRFVLESNMKAVNDVPSPSKHNPFYLLKKVDGNICRPLRRQRSDSNVMSDISDWDMNMDFSDTTFQEQPQGSFQNADQQQLGNVISSTVPGTASIAGRNGSSLSKASISCHCLYDLECTTDSELDISSHAPTDIIGDLVPAENLNLLSIDAREGYLKNHSRFHDFMMAALGMTVFDAADLWLQSEADSELHIVAGMHRDGVMNAWTVYSRQVRLKSGWDCPGQVLASAQPYWDKNYHQHSIFDQSFPRAALASKLSVRTAFGIPLPGPHGASGVLAFYARSEIDVDPLMVSLIQKAMQMISAGHVEASSLSVNKLQNVEYTPKKLLDDWMQGPGQGHHPSAMPAGGLSTSEHSGFSCSAHSQGSHGSNGNNGSNHAYTGTTSTAIGGSAYGLENVSAASNGAVGSGDPQRHRVTHAMRHKKKKANGPEVTMEQSDACMNSVGNNHLYNRPPSMPMPMAHFAQPSPNPGPCQPFCQPPTWYPTYMPDSHANYPTYQGLNGAHGYPTMNLMPMPLPAPFINPLNPLVTPAPAGTGTGPAPTGYGSSAVPNPKPSVPTKVKGNPNPNPTSTGNGGPGPGPIGPIATHGKPMKLPLPGPGPNSNYCYETKPAKPAGACKSCKSEGCSAQIAGRSPYCSAHTGSRKCQHEGCVKCAQGSTNFCIGHGGGRRCTFPGCLKGARDKFFCAAHGGGKRCTFTGCTKSAVGGSNLCTAHGGGKRCSVPGCTKSSQSKTMLCVRHGGGRKCSVAGCTKVSRGRTDYCAGHGGGVRCRVETCNKAAIGKYQLCRTHHSAITGENVNSSQSPVGTLPDEGTLVRKDSGGVFGNGGGAEEYDFGEFDYAALEEDDEDGGIKHLDEMMALAQTQVHGSAAYRDLPESEAEKQRVYASEVLAYLQAQQQKQLRNPPASFKGL